MPIIPDQATFQGLGANGAIIKAYKASRFTSPPGLNAAPPSDGAGPDAGPVTAGVNFGGAGQFEITVPTEEDYFLSAAYAGQTAWVRKVWLAGNGSSVGTFANGSRNFLDDGTGKATFVGALTAPDFYAHGNGSLAIDFDGNGNQVGQLRASTMAIGYDTAQFNIWDNIGGKAFRFYDAINQVTRFAVDGSGNLQVPGMIRSSANPAIIGGVGNVQVQLVANLAKVTLGQVPGGGMQMQTVNSSNAVVNTLDDGTGNLTAAGVVTANGGVSLPVSQAPSGVPNLHSDSNNIFLETKTAGAIYLRVGGTGSNNNMLFGSGGSWATYDSTGAQRNTLDDGTGNLKPKLNVLTPAGQGVDTSAAGALKIGGATATSVVIGGAGTSNATLTVSPGAVTVAAGNIVVPVNQGIDTSTAGQLLIGVNNATSVFSAIPFSIRSSIAPGNGTAVGSQLFSGTGAPAAGLGNNGDFYFRSDGGSLTTVYQKRTGTWTGVV